MNKVQKTAVVVVATFALGGTATACGGSDTSSPQPTKTVTAQPKQEKSTPKTKKVEEPKPKKAEKAEKKAPEKKKEAPAVTVSQEQALQSAQSYLDNLGGFSKAGLLDQLTSEYGEGFSQADAEYAVAHVDVDWNEQALISAKSYMENLGGFSRASLLDQLTSPYGEQFTQAQAEYAVDHVGL